MPITDRCFIVVFAVCAALVGTANLTTGKGAQKTQGSTKVANLAKPSTDQAIAEAMWKKIANARSELSPEKRTAEYWADIQMQCSDAFLMINRAKDSRVVLKHYVSQFGKHGADADLRWLCIHSFLTLPGSGATGEMWRNPPDFWKVGMEMSNSSWPNA